MKNTLVTETFSRHALRRAKPQKCIQLNSKNIPCNAYAQKGRQYCWRHSPEVSDEEKKKHSARGGKAKREYEGIKLPPIKITGIDDIVTLLGDTLNRIRDGSISPKFAASTAYVAMTLIMAMKQSEAAKERKRIEELKANGLWPEPVFPPKTYVYKDKFYVDKDGKKYFEDCTPAFSHLRPEDEEPPEESDDGFEDENENDSDYDNENENDSDYDNENENDSDYDNENENDSDYDNENEEPLPACPYRRAPELRQAGETQEPQTKDPETQEPESIFNNPSIDIVFASNNLSPVGGDSS